jgi:cell division septation protein DedD
LIFPKIDIQTPTVSANSTAPSLDRSDTSTTEALYRSAIGTVNIDYYLPIFSRFDANNRAGLCWNGAASHYTLNWMIFRRLWRAALVYAVAVSGTLLAAYGIDRLFFQFSEPVEIGLCVALATLYFVVPGLYGNALLYKASRRKMEHAMAVSKSLPKACSMLNQQASSRARFIRLVVGNVALVGGAAAAYALFQPSISPLFGQHKSREIPELAVRPTTDPAMPPTTEASATAPTVQPAASVALLETSLNEDTAIATPTKVASESVTTQFERLPRTAIEPKPAVTPAKATASTARVSVPTPATHFYINVGLFADRENAHNARRKLLKEGLPASTKELKTKNGLRTRVRVGPFDTRSETEAAVAKIHDLGLEAIAIRR